MIRGRCLGCYNKLRGAATLLWGAGYRNGGIVKGWPLIRLAISKIANKITAKIVVLPITDFTSGFRCYSRG